jgi:hypothetical protein
VSRAGENAHASGKGRVVESIKNHSRAGHFICFLEVGIVFANVVGAPQRAQKMGDKSPRKRSL